MSSTYKRDDLAIDQQLALSTAARRLAETFAGTFGPETIERFLHTSYDQVNPAAVASMAELGIYISREFPKPWTEEIVRAADVVVTMGCGDACPVYPGKRYLDWDLDDPAGKSTEEIRPIRDDIKHRVRQLLAELEVQ